MQITSVAKLRLIPSASHSPKNGSKELFKNGLKPNELLKNGLKPNELPRNGLKPNELAKNGLKPNGVPKNGFKANGLLNNGEKPKWLVKIWSSRNGLMPPRWNGAVPNGLPVNGLLVNGLLVNGLPVNGLPVNGLETNRLVGETDIARPVADWFCGICRPMIMDLFWGIDRFIMDGFRGNCPTIMPCRIRAERPCPWTVDTVSASAARPSSQDTCIRFAELIMMHLSGRAWE